MTDLHPGVLPDRAVLRLSGEGVVDFLQGLVTNDVSQLSVTNPLYAGLLSPQGKALHDFILWTDHDGVLVDCEGPQVDVLAKRLAAYRLRRPITIERDPDLVAHWSPRNNTSLPDPRLPELGWRWLAPPTGPECVGWREHRLSLGVVEGVAELGDGTTLWLECNAGELNGVSYEKGCYVGQENTARMHHRSKVNRRLVVAPLGEPGDRTRATYPDLGLMVEHRRVEELGDAIVPDWLRPAMGAPEEA